MNRHLKKFHTLLYQLYCSLKLIWQIFDTFLNEFVGFLTKTRYEICVWQKRELLEFIISVVIHVGKENSIAKRKNVYTSDCCNNLKKESRVWWRNEAGILTRHRLQMKQCAVCSNTVFGILTIVLQEQSNLLLVTSCFNFYVHDYVLSKHQTYAYNTSCLCLSSLYLVNIS